MAFYETFGDIYRAVLYDLGWVTPGDASADFVSAVKRAVNDVHRTIHNKTRGRFLQRRRNYRTAASVSKTAGATVSVGSTTVQLDTVAQSITLTDLFLGRDILLGTSLLPYAIVGYNTTPTPDEITIAPAYVGDAALSDAAFTIYDTHLTLPDDFDDVIAMVHMEDHRTIYPLPYQEARRRFPNPWQSPSSGRPTHWSFDGELDLESPGATALARPRRAWLLPINQAAFDLELVYKKIVAQLVNDTDTPDLPPEFRQYLKHGAFVQAGQTFGNKDPRALALSVQAFREGIEAMNEKPREEQRPQQLGSVYDGMRSALTGNLPEDDVFADQFTDPNFWP